MSGRIRDAWSFGGWVMVRFALAVACLAVGVSLAADDDPVKEKLDAAKKAYDAEMSRYRQQSGEWFDKREGVARAAGDKKQVDQIKAERAAFDETGELPKAAPADLSKKAASARKSLEAAYAQAVKEYTRARKDDEAAAVEREWAEIARGNTVDLLALASPKDHVVSGEWRRDGKALVGASGDKQARLQLPYEPGEEYDVEVRCKRIAGEEGFCLGLVAGGRQVLAAIDTWPSRGYATGLEYVDKKEVWENVTTVKGAALLKANMDNTIVCSVRGGKIDVQVNGKPATSFKGDFARLTLHEGYRVPNAKALFLLLGPKASYRIDRIVVRPVKGKGTILK